MEKEFLGIMLAVANYRDYMMAAPITYLLTDSQPVCWALRHREDNLKLSRWVLKLYEYNINFVVTHLHGTKNCIADFLSRVYYVHDITKHKKGNRKETFSAKWGCHVKSPFDVHRVLTKDVLHGFHKEAVTPCVAPFLCNLNANRYLFDKVVPGDKICNDIDIPSVNKVLSGDNFSFSPDSLKKHLTLSNIQKSQSEDPQLQPIIHNLNNNVPCGNYFLQNNILWKKFTQRNDNIVIPKTLIPYVLSTYHFLTHAGSEKLLSTIQLNYTWKNMVSDVKDFCKGCVLCSIHKNSSTGPNEIGTPRVISEPRKYWQMDLCTGLVGVKGMKSYLNLIDLYTGFSIPIALKSETSGEIARLLDENLIKVFGPPLEISSDNASNLSGPEIKSLFSFYGIVHTKGDELPIWCVQQGAVGLQRPGGTLNTLYTVSWGNFDGFLEVF
jgi:hypothetical protein